MTASARKERPGLYIHIPFCLSRCGYCTFASGLYEDSTASAYLTALESEIHAKDIHTPSTLFIGGGTPTSLSTGQMERLLSFLPRPHKSAEWTCEINPDTVTLEKMRLLKDSGVNRVSFGVQTFDDEGLRILGRRHDSSSARAAVELAITVGFDSVNLDLIHGWPGQDKKILQKDLDIAADLGVQHISNYALILDENAVWYKKFRQELPEGEEDSARHADLFQMVHDHLSGRGYHQYETSNFSLPGFQCRHNVHTWKGWEYWGVGLSAHSHVDGRRFANTTVMAEYLRNAAKQSSLQVFSEQLDPESKARETAVFWLRLFEGIRLDEFHTRTGFDFFSLYGPTADALLDNGLLETSRDRRYVRVPLRHQVILDSILVELV